MIYKYQCVAYDMKKDILYIFCDKALVILNVTTKKYKVHKNATERLNCLQAFVIKNELHIFGLYHAVWMRNQENIFKFHEYKHMRYHGNYDGIVYLETKQRILLMYRHNNYIGIYNTDTIELEIKEIKFPKGVKPGFYVAVDNDNYVVFGSGFTIKNGVIGYHSVDLIFMLNAKKMKFVKCKIKCPVKDDFLAIVMDSDIVYKLMLVGGYLQSLEEDNIIDLSSDLVQMISMFYYEECLHLLARHEGNHWKIQVTDILPGIK